VRLGAHRNGAAAVGSALLCHKPTNVVALAAHLSLFSRRMPRIPPREALAYGASYDRRLFAENGLFRDDIEGGEDTEFHRRLAEPDKPEWHPEVRTIHVGCEKLGSFLADQFRRGRRSADAWREIGTMGSGSVAKAAIRRNRFIVGNALTVVEPHQRWAARLAIPLIVMGNIAYAAGALASGFSRAGAQADRGRQST
jgi:hypothetical protein